MQQSVSMMKMPFGYFTNLSRWSSTSSNTQHDVLLHPIVVLRCWQCACVGQQRHSARLQEWSTGTACERCGHLEEQTEWDDYLWLSQQLQRTTRRLHNVTTTLIYLADVLSAATISTQQQEKLLGALGSSDSLAVLEALFPIFKETAHVHATKIRAGLNGELS
jgi:hypothetical protein